jgi:hypothetical protein
MTIAFNSSLLMAKSASVLAYSICRSRSNTCKSVTPLVGGAEVSIEVAEVEDSSMEVVLEVEDDDFAMEAESEEAESEVKLGRVGLSERGGSVSEDTFRSFLVGPACSPS